MVGPHLAACLLRLLLPLQPVGLNRFVHQRLQLPLLRQRGEQLESKWDVVCAAATVFLRPLPPLVLLHRKLRLQPARMPARKQAAVTRWKHSVRGSQPNATAGSAGHRLDQICQLTNSTNGGSHPAQAHIALSPLCLCLCLAQPCRQRVHIIRQRRLVSCGCCRRLTLAQLCTDALLQASLTTRG